MEFLLQVLRKKQKKKKKHFSKPLAAYPHNHRQKRQKVRSHYCVFNHTVSTHTTSDINPYPAVRDHGLNLRRV